MADLRSWLIVFVCACGPGARPGTGGGTCDSDGAKQCLGTTVQECVDGDWSDVTTCAAHYLCAHHARYSPFAIVVSNPDPLVPAMVTLTNHDGITAHVAVAPQTVQTLIPNDLGFPDQSLDYSGIETKAYHMTSDRP